MSSSASESLFSQLTDDSSHDDQMKAILEQLKKLDCLEDLKASILSNKEEMQSLGKAVSDLQDQQLKDMEEMKAEILSLKTPIINIPNKTYKSFMHLIYLYMYSVHPHLSFSYTFSVQEMRSY